MRCKCVYCGKEIDTENQNHVSVDKPLDVAYWDVEEYISVECYKRPAGSYFCSMDHFMDDFKKLHDAFQVQAKADLKAGLIPRRGQQVHVTA